MSEDRPKYRSGFREADLTVHSLREIASHFASALQDLTGYVYEVEITALDRRPQGEPFAAMDDVADIRMRVRRVDDSEFEGVKG